jgi:hypothetical protein
VKIIFEVTPKDGVDPLIFGQAIAWLQQIDAGAVVTRTVAVGEVSAATKGPASVVAPDLSASGHINDGVENLAEEGEEVEEAAANAAVTANLATAAAAVGPKKRGRKPKGQTAEAQVAALTGALPPGAMPPGVTQPAFTPPPVGVAAMSTQQAEQGGGFAIPPGAVGGNGFAPQGMSTPMAPPAGTNGGPGSVPVAPPPAPAAAMPSAAPPSPAPNGVVSLEDYKAQVLQLQNAAQAASKTNAYPFNIIRADTWPDGTPKPFKTMMHDSVPPEHRQLVLDWSAHLLNS